MSYWSCHFYLNCRVCSLWQMSVEQMAKATRGLPEFQELSKKMSQHVRLSQDCMDKVS